MNFEKTTDQIEIINLVDKFVANEIIPQAANLEETKTFPREIINKAWKLGLLNTCIPEEFGGAGFSTLDSIMITERLAYGCAGVNTSIMANDLALLPIVIAGTQQQKKKYLTAFTESPLLASFCLTEPSYGSDAAGIKTTIVDKNDHYLVNGNKMWITNAGFADLYIVYGKTNPNESHKGMGAIIIDKDTPGIEIGGPENKMGHTCSDTRAVTFNNVKVPKENLLGKPNEAWSIAMKTLDHSRPMVASSAVGIAQRTLDCAVGYAKERIQFNRPISSFQAIQMMIADMEMNIEAARLMTQKAAWKLDKGLSNTKIASCAKAFAADMAMQVTTDAVQIYGGYGYSREYPVEKLMRDAKLIQIYEGTSQIQRLVISKETLLRS